jgi:hypothetical protein
VIELKHFDPSPVNQNSRAPVDLKLRTQKDGCLQIIVSHLCTKGGVSTTKAGYISGPAGLNAV